jgi:hypothetical protein
MLKTLIDYLGWVPFLGQSLKIAYISGRAAEIVKGLKIDSSKANLQGEELEKHISEMSANAYEEHLKPEVDKYGLPEFVTNKVSDKSIEIISGKLRERYQSGVS